MNCFSGCDVCAPPPWNGKGIDSSFVKLYVNNAEVGTAYTSGNKVGKQYVISNAIGSYDLEVVARAPKEINLTILVKFNGSVVLNETLRYSNYHEFTFELPSTLDFEYLEVSNLQGSIPYWEIVRSGYWRWVSYYCTYYDNHNDGNVLLNAWIVEPDGTKNMAFDVVRSYIYDIEYSYENSNPQEGTYKIVVVPTSKEPETFRATVYLKRIDAAKLAAIQFNSMLGDGDFVGLTKFSTDASRVAVNSSPLMYMTKDKGYVDDEIRALSPGGATDHADALYWGIQVFPIWGEAGNNCTECINNTRPLMILLTDGETTECDTNNYFGCNLCSGSCDGRWWCQSGADQAKCVANYIKNNIQINGFDVPICTIGFGTDIGSNGQELLREIASPRPDNNEPCYFFATTSEELLNVYKTIFNIFQIAAKNISINESLNVTINGPFEFVSASASSDKGSPVSLQVERLSSATVVKINVSAIQKDETIELVVRLKVKEDASDGIYEINNEGSDISYIDFTPLNYLGQETTTCPSGTTSVGGKCRMPIISDRDKVVITTERGEISLNSRGVSEVVGALLTVVVIVTAAGLIYMISHPFISSSIDNINFRNAVKNMAEIKEIVQRMKYGSEVSTYKVIQLNGGSITNSGYFNVTVTAPELPPGLEGNPHPNIQAIIHASKDSEVDWQVHNLEIEVSGREVVFESGIFTKYFGTVNPIPVSEPDIIATNDSLYISIYDFLWKLLCWRT